MTISAAVPWSTIEDAIVAWVRAGSNGLPVIWSAQNKARPPAPYIALRVRASKRVPNKFTRVKDNPLAYAPRVVGIAGSAVAITAHDLALGDGPLQFTTTGTLPDGLAVLTDYWMIRVDANNLKVATSFRAARAGTFVTLSGVGSGTISLTGTADTRRAGEEILFVAGGYLDVTLSLQCFAAPTVGGAGATGALQILDQVIATHMLPSQHDALKAAGVVIYDYGPTTALGEARNGSVFEPRAVGDVKIYLDSNISEPGTIIEFVELHDTVRDADFEVSS